MNEGHRHHKIAGFDLAAVELGNSNEVMLGEPVVINGSPRGLQGRDRCVVSALRDDPSGSGFRSFQTDDAANPATACPCERRGQVNPVCVQN